MTSPSSPPLVCVTGATGFVGQHVCRLLQESSQPFRRLVRPQHKNTISPDPSVCFGSLDQQETWSEFLQGAHTVIHLASKHIDLDQTGFHSTNVEGTKSLCQAAIQSKVKRIVYLSSVGVYGHSSLRQVEESYPVRPDTALSHSKAEAEQILLHHHRQGDFQVVIARPRFIYGPGDQHFLPRLAKATQQRTWLPCSGKAAMSLVHVEDLAALLLKFGRTALPSDSHPVYHVANDSPVHLRSIITNIATTLSCPPPRFVPIPFPLLYYPLKGLEYLTGTDPETTKRSFTSIRLGFLSNHQWLSTTKLRSQFPDFTFRRLEDSLSVALLRTEDSAHTTT